MADPISTAGSVIAIVACAAETAEFLFKVLRSAGPVSDEINQLSQALESLHATLLGLQQCSLQLHPNLQFPDRFRRRLEECLRRLDDRAFRIRQINIKINNTKPARWNVERCWGKTKWLMFGEKETRKFMEIVRLYQSEFTLELLTLLVSIHGGPSHSVDPEGTRLGPTVTSCPQDQALPLQERIVTSPTYSPSDSNAGTGSNILRARSVADLPFSQQQYTHPSTDTTQGLLRAQACGKQSVRADRSIRLESLLYDCLLRFGPLIEMRTGRRTRSADVISAETVGYGCGLTLSLPRRCRHKMNLAFYFVGTLVGGPMKFAIHLTLSLPRIVPQNSKSFQLARAGDFEGLQDMFSASSATPNDTTVHGISLMHTASRMRNTDLVKLLIQQGADVNAPDEDGITPLHGALSFEDNYQLARLLIEAGADPGNRTVDGKTTLHTQFTNTLGQVMMKADFLEETLTDAEGLSISHLIAHSNRSTVVDFLHGQAYDMMDLWTADRFGRTCLHLAAKRGNLSILEYLLIRAPPHEVTRKDSQGRTPLHYSVQSSRCASTIDLLLANGGQVFTRDDSGCNLLHHASRWGNLKAIRKTLSLDAGRTLLCRDAYGRMPSHYATRALSGTSTYLSKLESTTCAGFADNISSSQAQSHQQIQFPPRELPDFPHIQSSLRREQYVFPDDRSLNAQLLSFLPTDPPNHKLSVGSTTTVPPTSESLTENHHFLSILQSVIGGHAHQDPDVQSQAQAMASSGGSNLGSGGVLFPQQRQQRSGRRGPGYGGGGGTGGDGAGGASSRGGMGGAGRGGHIHVYDYRHPPDFGRIPDPEDIFGSLEVDGAGRFVDGHGNYQTSGTYRMCTRDGMWVR
ncbi:MAG: hypothetical protein Q9220_002300 [cf. Caloplaca sp. 1 TL-2023]